MRFRKLGQSGIEASTVAVGTWAIGGWMWGGTDEQDSIDAIRAGLDAGVNFIDTAPAYGLGLSEEIVGRAIEGRREEVVLATKCGLVWDTERGEHFVDQGDKSLHRYLGAESVRQEVEDSLRRLNTDYIDLYQTHWQDPTTPIEETMKALMQLKEEGKIRAIGVSNATVEDMDEYRKVGPVDCDQEEYNMIDRELEDETLPYCTDNNIAVLAYSPLARGMLTGKMTPDREFPEGDQRRESERFSVANRRRVQKMLDELKPIAEDYDLSFAQLAVAWALEQPGLTHALVGARNPQQARENARAGAAELGGADVDQINEVIDRYLPDIE